MANGSEKSFCTGRFSLSVVVSGCGGGGLDSTSSGDGGNSAVDEDADSNVQTDSGDGSTSSDGDSSGEVGGDQFTIAVPTFTNDSADESSVQAQPEELHVELVRIENTILDYLTKISLSYEAGETLSENDAQVIVDLLEFCAVKRNEETMVIERVLCRQREDYGLDFNSPRSIALHHIVSKPNVLLFASDIKRDENNIQDGRTDHDLNIISNMWASLTQQSVFALAQRER